MEWKYENDSEIFQLYCIKKQLDEMFPNCDKILYVPYFPHARMDRIHYDKEQTDVFTLKYFCELLNNLKFNKVRTLDLHSNVSAALINNLDEIKIDTLISEILPVSLLRNENLVIYFPDEGAMKRYSNDIKLTRLGKKPICYGIKVRDWETGKIKSIRVETNGLDIKGKDILIIDDICSRGGTFYYAAKELQKLGVEDISLYVTHLEKVYAEGDLYKEKDTLLKGGIYTANRLL